MLYKTIKKYRVEMQLCKLAMGKRAGFNFWELPPSICNRNKV